VDTFPGPSFFVKGKPMTNSTSHDTELTDASPANVAPAPGIPRLLTPEDVAAALCVSERTLERWRYIGEGPRFVKLTRNTVRYTQEDLASFVAERIKANTI